MTFRTKIGFLKVIGPLRLCLFGGFVILNKPYHLRSAIIKLNMVYHLGLYKYILYSRSNKCFIFVLTYKNKVVM